MVGLLCMMCSIFSLLCLMFSNSLLVECSGGVLVWGLGFNIMCFVFGLSSMW